MPWSRGKFYIRPVISGVVEPSTFILFPPCDDRFSIGHVSQCASLWYDVEVGSARNEVSAIFEKVIRMCRGFVIRVVPK